MFDQVGERHRARRLRVGVVFGQLLTALAVGPAAASVQAPEPLRLVADLAPGRALPWRPQPHFLAAFGKLALFAVDDGFAGLEPWVTDGTSRGTRRLGDLCPGRCDSLDVSSTRALAVGRRAFFLTGSELYATDGTPEGTWRLLDAAPRPAASRYLDLTAGRGDNLYFVVSSPEERVDELWLTDGTPGGTRRLLRQTWSGDLGLRILGNTPAGLLFAGLDGSRGRELWLHDGTRARPLVDLARGPASGLGPSSGVAITHGGRVLFAADDGPHGLEPWVSDGTRAGTRLLRDITPGAEGGGLREPVVVGPYAYFAARDVSFEQTFRTDGTPEGTRPLRRAIGFELPIRVVHRATQHGDRFVFPGDRFLFPGFDEPKPLWVNTGKPESTQPLQEVPLHARFSEPPVSTGGARWFLVGTPEGTEVWRTDGRPGGTRRVLPAVQPGFSTMVAAGGRLLLGGLAGEGVTLWRSATSTGQIGLYHRFPVGARSSYPDTLTAWRDDLAFLARHAEARRGLWIASAGKTSPQLVSASLFPAAPEVPTALVSLGDHLVVQSPGNFRQGRVGPIASLSRSGSLAEIAPNSNSWIYSLGDAVLFLTGNFDAPGQWVQGLWRTDGTVAGTGRIARVDPPLSSTALATHRLFFVSTGALWVSDGTAAGTHPSDGDPCGSVTCHPLAGSGDRVFFVAREPGAAGDALWVSNGTAGGTREVIVWPDGRVDQLASFADGRALAVVELPDGAEELWVSDGTLGGTFALLDPRPGPALASPGGFTSVAGRLFFSADDGVHGRELWASDGTPEGTRLWADVRPGPLSGTYGWLAKAGGGVAFSADDGLVGLEPWWASAAEPGSRRIADVAPGVTASDPRHFTVAGDQLYFQAGRRDVGYELWCVPLPTSTQ